MEDLSLDTLIKIGNKSLIVTSQLIQTLFIQITDLVFSFCYEMRTMGELTCESATIINKTSPTLSCLLQFNHISELVIKCCRRFLVYGLCRNFDIAKLAWDDTVHAFSEGKGCIIRVLINIKQIFDKSEPRYLLNRIFIDDFIIWIQKTEEFDDFVNKVKTFVFPSIENLNLNFSFTLD